MKDGITHLGLQFWHPTESGGIEITKRFKRPPITDSTINDFRKWGKDNGVKVMLCIYNTTSKGWDWNLAKAAFSTNRQKLIDAIVAETTRLELDGVDIDFEGNGNFDTDKKAFVQFIKDLSKRLHAIGKELTVDTFCYKWNAPNQTWWPELLPYIDGLHVMGYTEMSAGAKDWRSYEFVKAAGGKHASKLMLGVSGSADKWQNKPAQEHLNWFFNDDTVGMAIWDAQLKSTFWRKKSTWQRMKKFKQGHKQK